MNEPKQKPHFQTRAIHSGEDPVAGESASIPVLNLSTTFSVDPDTPFSAEDLDEHAPPIYTRWGNPTISVLEKKIANLEGGEAALAFASGIAAVSGLMLHKLKSGDQLIVSDISYAGVREFGNDLLKDLGIQVQSINLTDLDSLEKALQTPTKMVFAETPCNPLLRLTDIEAVANLCKQYGAELAVDSTFATPLITKPLELGADYVIHSMTKYIGGHGDAIGGVVVGKKSEIYALRQRVSVHIGGIISPFNAWLINRGLATLPLRMPAHSQSAMQVAQFLEKHPAVKSVNYPGLPSHPQYALAQKQMKLPGGMMSIQTHDPIGIMKRAKERLAIFHYAVSLGHHKSLIFYLSTSDMQASTFRLQPKQLNAYKDMAGEGLFRISIGLEHPDDLCADLDRLLSE